jgi:hypothetical protein
MVMSPENTPLTAEALPWWSGDPSCHNPRVSAVGNRDGLAASTTARAPTSRSDLGARSRLDGRADSFDSSRSDSTNAVVPLV